MTVHSAPRGPLVRIRDAIGMTQIEVAAVAGVSLATIRKIEAADPEVRIRLIVKVAGAVGCAPTELYPVLRTVPEPGTAVERRSRGRLAALRRQQARARFGDDLGNAR